MIRQATSPLPVDMDCRQVSCHFDYTLLRDATAGRFDLTLPKSLDNAVQKRKAEFLAGRYCARAALAALDGPETEIGVGANRQPLWPPGFVGSITHTRGYASALVARQERVRAAGLDSEAWIAAESAENVNTRILTSHETHASQQHLFLSYRHYLTMVFSAKESLFKCLYPLTNQFFDFHAAVIIPEPSGSRSGGAFRYELLTDLDAEFRTGYRGFGTYAVDTAFVHTAVVLRAQPFG